MRKLRSDALWHKLTSEQQNQIQHWLFVERLGYVSTHERMQKELGITCSLSTIGPMYHYLSELRSHERETILQRLTDVITEPGADLKGIRTDSLAIITKRLMDRAMERDDTTKVAALGRVMLQGEGHELERDRLELAREKLAFAQAQAVVACGTSDQPVTIHQEKADIT